MKPVQAGLSDRQGTLQLQSAGRPQLDESARPKAGAQPKASPQPKGRSATSYIPGLDGIRAIAFLLVFWAHALPGIGYYIPATLGVTIFFFLSGYLITTLLRKEIARTGGLSLRDFYIRRTLRIFVPLYLVYTLACLLSRFAFDMFPGNRFGFFSMLFYFYNYTNVLRWHAWPPMGMSVIWSLAVEEHFYILFPLVLIAMTRRRLPLRRQIGLLVAFCALELVWRIVLIAVIREHSLWTYFATDARLDSILWGCILALANNPVAGDRSILPAQRRYQFPIFAAALLLLVASLFPRGELYKEAFRYTLQALLLYVIFSFVIARTRHWSVAWLEWLPLRYLGWISYVLYLSHGFVLSVLENRFQGSLWTRAILGFALSIGFATAMRYTVELPLQSLRARFRRVPEADPGAPDGHGLIA